MGAKLHIILALPVNSVANVTLSSLKQMLAKVKYGCPAWFDLLHPHLLPDTKGLLPVLWGGDNAKVPGTDPPYWELICSNLSNIFEKPGTPPERAIEH